MKTINDIILPSLQKIGMYSILTFQFRLDTFHVF